MSSAAPPLPHVDFAHAIAELGGMRALYQEAAALFLADAPRQLQAFEAALMADQRNAARRAAHTLKAMAASLGAGPLAAHALELEVACRGGSDPQPALAACHVELAAVAAAVQSFLNE